MNDWYIDIWNFIFEGCDSNFDVKCSNFKRYPNTYCLMHGRSSICSNLVPSNSYLKNRITPFKNYFWIIYYFVNLFTVFFSSFACFKGCYSSNTCYKRVQMFADCFTCRYFMSFSLPGESIECWKRETLSDWYIHLLHVWMQTPFSVNIIWMILRLHELV